MRSDLERIRDIQEAINNIEKYAIQGKAEFFANELIQSWILLQLQIIGEAARSMAAATHKQYPKIIWRDIIDFRNLLVHEYFRVDLKIIWQIIEQEIPILKKQINLILKEE
ncbi:HepT-like ribonuclease domain-containing protein [Pleurocapsa sp. FMAR1]|uniref:HepT-like ribonuclease domain-containing protein n=1 Tax=Pleurocapsa sp. FMAR1 TaxID=3040204 RepID=UPI0029C724F6|nr:HepT-like ribonuclease domain-containing protein [Pleurocapsa sp. FMAR1]